MKKIKGILLALLAVVMALAIPMTAACDVDDNEEPAGKTLEAISLDVSNAAKYFNEGDNFSAEGLVIIASFNDAGELKTENLAYNAEGVSVDSSAYDKTKLGDYVINVSYTYSGVTKASEYTVAVIPLRRGLSVSYKSGIENSVNLSSSNKTADLSDAVNWIEVRQPDKSGAVDLNSAPLSANEYTVKFFKDRNEITDLSSLKRGAYQIWASKQDDGQTLEGFVLYFVVDEVEKIEFKSGELTQQRGLKDIMSSTWSFTVTYKSGDTVDVESSNRYIVIPDFNCNATENTGVVTVVFNEPLPNGASQSKSVDVTYTLTGEKAVPDMAILNAGDMDAVDKQYVTPFTTFEVLGGAIVSRSLVTINFPIGIEVDGKTSIRATQAYQSGGATTADKPRKIKFSTNRNFEIYVYGLSNSNGDLTRKILINATSSNGDYIDYNPVDNCKTMLDDGLDAGNSLTVRAQSVTNVEEMTDFELTFTGSINLFYVLIVFETV